MAGIAALGPADSWTVESESTPGRAYLVVRLVSGGWLCSCPADHKRLSELFRPCKTVARVKETLAAEPTPKPHLELVKGAS